MNTPNEYECALCHGVFVETWPESEVDAEYRANFPAEAAENEPRAVVCHDCYVMIMANT